MEKEIVTGLGFNVNPSLMTPPLNGDYNRDPNMAALQRTGFINHGSTLGFRSQQTPRRLRKVSGFQALGLEVIQLSHQDTGENSSSIYVPYRGFALQVLSIHSLESD